MDCSGRSGCRGEETGIDPRAKWFIGEGADAIALTRSVPLHKGLDDAMIALYQNGERLRPGNGYPMRLFLPGWEGNASVKWLRSIKVTDRPAMSKDETSKYSDLRADGTAELFTFPMGVKSVITSPSPGLDMALAPGLEAKLRELHSLRALEQPPAERGAGDDHEPCRG